MAGYCHWLQQCDWWQECHSTVARHATCSEPRISHVIFTFGATCHAEYENNMGNYRYACGEAGISCVSFIFCTYGVAENMKITQQIPGSSMCAKVNTTHFCPWEACLRLTYCRKNYFIHTKAWLQPHHYHANQNSQQNRLEDGHLYGYPICCKLSSLAISPISRHGNKYTWNLMQSESEIFRFQALTIIQMV